MKTVDANFVENVIMEESQTCWAACIDMVVKEKNIQKIVVDKLKSLKGSSANRNSTTMPCNEKYYTKLFGDNLFTDKGCNQYQSLTFPNQQFIIDCITKDNPIIFSGIFYPLLYDSNTHAIVVQGYKKDDEKFWVLAFDPIRKKRTCKIAWVYNELIKFDSQKRTNSGEKIDFITDFKAPSPKYINQDFSAFTLPINHEYATPDSLKKAIDLVNLVKDSKKELLIDYFQVLNIENLNFIQPSVPWIPKYNIQKFTQSNISQRLFFYPVWGIDKVVKLEFIFYEELENKLTLIGIQEPEFFYEIKKVKVFRDGKWVELNVDHENRKYEVYIDSVDNVYLIVRDTDFDNQIYYVPVEDYKNSIGEILNQGQGYSEIEFKNFNIEHSSVNDMSPNFEPPDLFKNESLKNLDYSIQKNEIQIDRKDI